MMATISITSIDAARNVETKTLTFMILNHDLASRRRNPFPGR
jgi:hypothetical protein